MSRESVIAEWRRATESMGAARSCQRDGYYADSVSRAYYAILHAAKAALQLHDVDAESHTGVKRMFGLHIVKTGLIEPEWSAEIGRSEDRRIASDYDAMLHFDETGCPRRLRASRRLPESHPPPADKLHPTRRPGINGPFHQPTTPRGPPQPPGSLRALPAIRDASGQRSPAPPQSCPSP